MNLNNLTEFDKEILKELLEDKHDNDMEYLEVCDEDNLNDEENFKEHIGTINRINMIRKLLGDKELITKWSDIEK